MYQDWSRPFRCQTDAFDTAERYRRARLTAHMYTTHVAYIMSECRITTSQVTSRSLLIQCLTNYVQTDGWNLSMAH